MTQHFVPYQHYTSPRNFAPEVLSQLSIPEPVNIHDSTVRKILLTPGVRASVEELAGIARLSYDVGLTTTVLNVHWWGSAQPEPFALEVARCIARESSARVIISTDVFNQDRWREAVPVLAELRPAAVSMDIRIPDIEGMRDVDLEQQLERLEGGCQLLRAEGIEPMLGVLDLGRVRADALQRFLEVGLAAGATSILLHDSASSLSPEAMKLAVRDVRAQAPGVPVVMHVHNDVGLADAACLAAVTAGAHPDVSAGGVSYRAGFASLEGVAGALTALYGVDLGLDWPLMQELCRRVDVLIPPGGFRALTGSRAFLKESTAALLSDGSSLQRPVAAPDSVVCSDGFGGEDHFVWGRNVIANDGAIGAKLRLLGLDDGTQAVREAREKLIRGLEAVSEYPFWIDDAAVDAILAGG